MVIGDFNNDSIDDLGAAALELSPKLTMTGDCALFEVRSYLCNLHVGHHHSGCMLMTGGSLYLLRIATFGSVLHGIRSAAIASFLTDRRDF